MNTLQKNAILAGLRLLQDMRLVGRVPGFILKILQGENQNILPLNNAQIDLLCESINFGELDRPAILPAVDPERFEVSRVHTWRNESGQLTEAMERCDADGCSEEHLFSVYVLNPNRDNRPEWISDHASEALAITAAAAYAPAFDKIIAAQH